MATIRVAAASDASGIAHVHVQSWLTTYPGIVPAAYLATLEEADRATLWREQLNRPQSATLIAVDEREIVGFVSGGPARDAFLGYDAEMYALYLLQPVQRRGIGRDLARALARELLDRGFGFAGIFAWVLEQNSAVEFYRALGGVRLASKAIEIGGASLTECAIGWPALAALL